MTPAQRILRTAIQVIIGLAAAVPAAVAAIGGEVDAALAAKVVGFAGAAIIIVTALQNALEAAGILPKILTGITRRERKRARKKR